MYKNTASQTLMLYAFDASTGLAKTGDAANITAYVSKDAGSVTALGDTSAVEVDSTNAKGWYKWDLTQAETNASILLFTGKSSTSNVQIVGRLEYTVAVDGNVFPYVTTSVFADAALSSLTEVLNAVSIRYATATGSAAGSLTLDASASANNTDYVGNYLNIPDGFTGAGQTRLITAYNGTTKVATVTPNWQTTPASNTKFYILPSAYILQTQAVASLLGNAVDIENAVWDAETANHTTGASFGEFFSQLSSNLDTVLARIGAFAGSGVNTILGFFRAIMRSDTTTPSDVGGSFDDATDSLQAIRDRGDAAWITATGFSTHSAADIWSVATRSLTALDEDSTTLDLDATIRAAVGMASANLDTQLDALPTANENADALLARNVAGGSSTGRTVSQALYALRNRVARSGSTITVYQTDDTTSSWTATITTDAAAEMITSMDPA